ncbi:MULTISPECIES: dipeptidase [unclassified Variovorax]|uniref:dipeptidase n=1 Tax=unclassified Variovorax TaxID=663243 RepID=UPI0008C27BE4|nr:MULTISPECIES: dipeptidase [unclassified Variovorax]SEJ88420.1 Acetylornithine deacetylase/Succinyl-diaminopimelate desuccinylase [Variovorax sp. OK202]SFD04712.1 Acetylornithine deacetylase/Succinyl-diaminopimelate desuccinylase [Variovorax sp. OK212]
MNEPHPVIDHLRAREPEIVDWLKAFLRIPSVSADPAFAPGMREARRFLLERMEQIGLAGVRLLDGGGEPAVYGEWNGAPGRPTLMVYGHYDVQPADPVEQWRTPPFEPTEVDGRLYGRGTSDVKGSTTIALEVIASFLAVQGACPVNIKVFLEGEEETGSPSLRIIVERHRALLQADAVLSADGGRASASVPTLNTGARGNAQLEVRLRTAHKDLHSGRYGGSVRNALHDMARLVASLHHADGGVAVDGFHDGAVPPTERQRADTAAFPYDEAAFFSDVGGSAHGESGYSARERVTLRPALDVNGLWGGYTGGGGKTIVPCEAQVKLTPRVVEGQDPRAVVRAVLRHLQAHCPAGCTLDVVAMNDGSPASTLAPGHPLVRAAEAVLERETGRRPIHVRLGASVPVTSIFKEMLGIDTLMFGFNLPDEDVHAPNEFFRLQSIGEGTRAWTLLLAELATHSPASFHAA